MTILAPIHKTLKAGFLLDLGNERGCHTRPIEETLQGSQANPPIWRPLAAMW